MKIYIARHSYCFCRFKSADAFYLLPFKIKAQLRRVSNCGKNATGTKMRFVTNISSVTDNVHRHIANSMATYVRILRHTWKQKKRHIGMNKKWLSLTNTLTPGSSNWLKISDTRIWSRRLKPQEEVKLLSNKCEKNDNFKATFKKLKDHNNVCALFTALKLSNQQAKYWYEAITWK